MPIFEYECLECAEQFEYLHRGVESAAECPGCGTGNVRRTLSLCAVSSDSSRAANLSAAHRRAAAKRTDRHRAEHSSHHGHFEDTARPTE